MRTPFLTWLSCGCGQWCVSVIILFGCYAKFDVIITSVLRSMGNCFVLRISGLDCKTSADKRRVPASARLSFEATWFHSLTLVCSKLSLKRFAIKIGYLVVELRHCETVVLSVLAKTLLTSFTAIARQICCFNRAASNAACKSSFGNFIILTGATRKRMLGTHSK